MTVGGQNVSAGTGFIAVRVERVLGLRQAAAVDALLLLRGQKFLFKLHVSTQRKEWNFNEILPCPRYCGEHRRIGCSCGGRRSDRGDPDPLWRETGTGRADWTSKAAAVWWWNPPIRRLPDCTRPGGKTEVRAAPDGSSHPHRTAADSAAAGSWRCSGPRSWFRRPDSRNWRTSRPLNHRPCTGGNGDEHPTSFFRFQNMQMKALWISRHRHTHTLKCRRRSTVIHLAISAWVYSSGRGWDAGRIFFSLAAAGDGVGGATSAQATPTACRCCSHRLVSVTRLEIVLKNSNDMQMNPIGLELSLTQLRLS